MEFRTSRPLLQSSTRVCRHNNMSSVASASATPSSSSQTSVSKSDSFHLKPRKPVTIMTLQKKFRNKHKISMVTAYDYSGGLICDQAGADIILVGDSVGMVVLGHDSTVPVTMEDMVRHCQAVRRGVRSAFTIADMPFGSYLTVDDAVRNAAELIKTSGLDSVKLEGGRKMADRIRAITDCGILVVGHIGLTPQTAQSLGGYKVQGKTARSATELYKDAMALQSAGCCMIVLECVPDRVAAHLTTLLKVPTIGIGAGSGCSGQVQVFHDLLGMYDRLSPKFSRKFAKIGEEMRKAVGAYCDEVGKETFPNESESFPIKDAEFEKFVEKIN
eukprot:998214_1